MAGKIRVGIIGASPERGWAAEAHIPALRALDEFEITAVSTSRRDSAEAAAAKFDVADAFDHYFPLVVHPNVDLVAVTVKVPYHHELVIAALNAGKAVYCEWPLGNGLEEAEEMAAIARDAATYAAVGLQARSSPVMAYLKDLIAEGYVGQVLSSTVVADAINWGPEILDCYTYLLERRNGATMLSIPFGHAVDALCWCLGEFNELTASFATRRPQVRHVESGNRLPSDVPDQIAVSGILQDGTVASIHYRGGVSRGTHFRWEINGTEGDLVVEAGGGHIQMLPLRLFGGRGAEQSVTELTPPDRYNPIGDLLLDNPQAASVARAYRCLAKDWATGKQQLPSFDDAVVRHRMLDAMTWAAEHGSRQHYMATAFSEHRPLRNADT